MAIKEIKVSPLFEKHYKNLPSKIKDKSKEKAVDKRAVVSI